MVTYRSYWHKYKYYDYFPVTIQMNLDQSFWLNLFLFHLQYIAFLMSFPAKDQGTSVSAGL